MKLRVRTQTLEPEPANTGVGSRNLAPRMWHPSLYVCREDCSLKNTHPVARRAIVASVVVSALALSACTPAAGPAQSSTSNNETSQSDATVTATSSITLLTHDSFNFPKELLEQFTKESGVEVKVQSVGDGGTLTNQLVLTKDAPLGDVVYGIDNTVAYRLLKDEIISNEGIPSPNKDLDISSIPGLVPIDQGDVCINLDKTWFTTKNIAQPTSLDDLTKPEYKDLLVAMNPATSTPGMAFMLATIEKYGTDGWKDYWKKLKDNGLKVTEGWSDAFSVDYSAGEGAGPRPLMVSYGSSPAYSVNEAGTESTTAAMQDSCYRQVEYAGVVKGAKNTEGAKAFVKYMLKPDIQKVIADNMYMYPTVAGVAAPEGFTEFGYLAEQPTIVSIEEIAVNGERWLRDWQEVISQ